MTLLSDAKSDIIKAFDVLNKAFAKGSPGYGLPHPIIFVSNAKGVVTHRFSETNYTSRPNVDLVLGAIGR
jgi:peroxiredoxin